MILTLVAFGATGSSEKFLKNVLYLIFLVEHGNTNRMVVWLKVLVHFLRKKMSLMVSSSLCLTSFIKVESRVSLIVHLFSCNRADARDMTTGIKVSVVHL